MTVPAALLALLAGLAAIMPAGGTRSATSVAACGAATQASVVHDYRAMAAIIYEGELAGHEVKQDARHVRASRALAAGLADGDAAAVLAATEAVVYHPVWHIVRLRVSSPSGSVVADVGGPYVLAPVRGLIRYHGKTVGRYAMSVQDDAGYAKLVARFSGLPIEIYARGQPVEGEDFPLGSVPESEPASGSRLTIAGLRYVTASSTVKAFPSGNDGVLLAVPLVSSALAARSCVAVNALTYTSIAIHLARQVALPGAAGVFVGVDQALDPGQLVFVMAGKRLLASSHADAAPPSLPRAGMVVYQDRHWLVESFAPHRGLRAFLLFPAAATGASSAAR
jgi:hypothetical protein